MSCSHTPSACRVSHCQRYWPRIPHVQRISHCAAVRCISISPASPMIARHCRLCWNWRNRVACLQRSSVCSTASKSTSLKAVRPCIRHCVATIRKQPSLAPLMPRPAKCACAWPVWWRNWKAAASPTSSVLASVAPTWVRAWWLTHCVHPRARVFACTSCPMWMARPRNARWRRWTRRALRPS